MKNNLIVAPSVLSADFSQIALAISDIEKSNAQWIHLDVMDGNFVPNITFGPKFIKDIRSYTELFFDTHLMIEKPERYLEEFAKAGSNAITVHYEACDNNLRQVLLKIKELGCMAGVSIKPDTSVEKIEDVLDIVDLVLVMSVNPGFGGQSFMPETMEKVRQLAKLRQNRFLISADGGLNLNTIKFAKEAGINVAVAGSAFFNNPQKSEFVEQMQNI